MDQGEEEHLSHESVKNLRSGQWSGLSERELNRVSREYERETGAPCDLFVEREFASWEARAHRAHPVEKEIRTAEAGVFQHLDEVAINWAADSADEESLISPVRRLEAFREQVTKVSKMSPTRAVKLVTRCIGRAKENYPPFLDVHGEALKEIRSSVMEDIISNSIVCHDDRDGVLMVLAPVLRAQRDDSDDEYEISGEEDEDEGDDEEVWQGE